MGSDRWASPVLLLCAACNHFPLHPRLGPLRSRYMHGCPVLLLLLDAMGFTAVRGLDFGLVTVLGGEALCRRRRAVKYKGSSYMWVD